jgi:hypothetical protein
MPPCAVRGPIGWHARARTCCAGPNARDPDLLGLDVGYLYDFRPPVEVIGDQFAVRRRVHVIGLNKLECAYVGGASGFFT